jgi:hypothetical protein
MLCGARSFGYWESLLVVIGRSRSIDLPLVGNSKPILRFR